MGLTFVLGRAKADKSRYIMDDIKASLQEKPIGPPIIYIVPEQMTFQQEYTLFSDQDIPGSIRAQVFSFSRLAWRVLTEVGGGAKQFISSTGTQMMLRKIIEQQEGTFNVFQRAVEKRGFIEELERVITEFKRHCVTPQILQEHINFIEHEPITNKLSDIHYIYDNLIQLLQHKYIDGEDQLNLLASHIPNTEMLKEAEIYIDGFHRFTPVELLVIEQLMLTCKRVTISLTTDQFDKNSQSEFDLFYQTTETYYRVKTLAEELNVTVNEPIVLRQEDKESCFAHLEANFDIRPTPEFNTTEQIPIQIAEAVHPRAEVEGVAQQILQLVRNNNYRYKDIVLYIRETDVYEDLIKSVFKDYNIPVFIDEKRLMLSHPLIEFVRSLIDMVDTNWRYDALFRVLKTGFIQPSNTEYPLTSDAIDQLENYVLEFGIRHKNQWISEDKWIYQRFRGFDHAVQHDDEVELEKKINSYRSQVVNILLEFDEAIRCAKTNLERCEAIYLLLEKVNVRAQLEYTLEVYDEQGQVEKAREQEQVWDALIQLLDECVELIGNEKMSLTMFKDILEAGFESLQFSHVPPTIDHVIVGTIDHSRISNKKCSFLIGVNEGVWPMTPPIEGIINEEERELLKRYGLELAESSRRILLDDLFYMYLSFTSAKDYLWVSYPISHAEGEKKEPSQMIRRLQDLFPTIQSPLLLQEVSEASHTSRFITTQQKTRSALSVQFSHYLRGYPIEDMWWSVLNWYINNESKNSLTYKVMQSLFYENNPVNLSKETVRKTYDRKIKASVSRLEMFYRCSYQHFAQYNLNLEERRTYQLAAPDIGQLFHEALKTITEWIQKEGKHFQDLTREDSSSYAKRSVAKLAPILQHRILSSSKRYTYIQRKLQDVIERATFILSEQARLSGFSPIGIELSFGFGEQLKPIIIPLENDYELVLRGRIDRVDKAEYNENLYLRIIDYKSSSHDLRLLDVYYGIALQMLTYLNVILSQSEQWLGKQANPAGVLYFHMHNNQLNLDSHLADSDLFDKLFSSHKMNGLLIENTEIVRLMDTSLESGYSQIIPAAITRKDTFYSNAKVADQSIFDQLQQYIFSLIERAGFDMISGDISLNPYEYKARNACTFCSFKSVCQFDPILPENNFKQLKEMKEDEILNKIQQNEREED